MPHPMSEFVLSAFTPENGSHDATTIAFFMAGITNPRIPNSRRNVMNAYRVVAEHVLASLTTDGRLQRDAQGWCVLPRLPKA